MARAHLCRPRRVVELEHHAVHGRCARGGRLRRSDLPDRRRPARSASRPGRSPSECSSSRGSASPRRPGWRARGERRTGVEVFELEPHPISSSELRERVRRGELGRRARRPRRRRVHRRARPVPRRLIRLFTATLSALSSLEQASRIAALATEKLAEDVVILDMRPVCVYTDFFVLATGRNPRQTKAIYDEVHGQLKQEPSCSPRAVDGSRRRSGSSPTTSTSSSTSSRPRRAQFYRLEDLWGDVPAVELEAATA